MDCTKTEAWKRYPASSLRGYHQGDQSKTRKVSGAASKPRGWDHRRLSTPRSPFDQQQLTTGKATVSARTQDPHRAEVEAAGLDGAVRNQRGCHVAIGVALSARASRLG